MHLDIQSIENDAFHPYIKCMYIYLYRFINVHICMLLGPISINIYTCMHGYFGGLGIYIHIDTCIYICILCIYIYIYYIYIIYTYIDI